MNKPVPKTPLGKVKLLHQAEEDGGDCKYCGKPKPEWKIMEECLPLERQSRGDKPVSFVE